MILFVRNISSTTTTYDLKKFAEDALVSWLPFRSGKIHYAKILRYKDMRTKLTEYHGLIFVDDKHGKVLLKKLNRTKLNNKYVNIREYKSRTSKNDRRTQSKIVDNTCNRLSDRRRGDLLNTIEYNVQIMAIHESRRQI